MQNVFMWSGLQNTFLSVTLKFVDCVRLALCARWSTLVQKKHTVLNSCMNVLINWSI